jgi:uncharacterized protein DUF4342
MGTQTNGNTWNEQLKVTGDRLVGEVRRLIAEGNVRRIIIKQGEHTVAEFPLTLGVAGAVLAPWLAGIGAIAALVTDSSIVVERVDQPMSPSGTEAAVGSSVVDTAHPA